MRCRLCEKKLNDSLCETCREFLGWKRGIPPEDVLKIHAEERRRNAKRKVK